MKKIVIPRMLRLVCGNVMGGSGIIIIVALGLVALLAPLLAPLSHNRRSGMPHKAPGEASYQFDNEALARLKQEQIPPEISEKLKAAPTIYPNTERLLRRIERQIGQQALAEYRDLIVKHATNFHLLGTTKMGKDVFSQLVYGGRVSLTVGFTAGLTATILAVLIGVTSGYAGGKIDEIIMFFTNVILVIPSLPLIIVIASFLGQSSPLVIGLVLAATGWAYGARVYRTQTLTLRRREFVLAAELLDERRWRIVLVEIFPNMISLVASGFVGGTIWFILAEAGLEFIGLGDPSSVTWGTMLFWGQRNGALQSGAWWEIIPPSVMILLTGASLVLINFTIDEITNPQLRTLKGMRKLRAFMSRTHRA